MTIISIILISIALSLDAFAVSLSLGIGQGINGSEKILMSCSFGFFQYLFAFIGGVFGIYILSYLGGYPKILGGVAICLVGLFMFMEGFKEEKENVVLKANMFIVLGISVSIDALVVGLTAFGSLGKSEEVLIASIIVGIITFINSIIAFFLGRKLRAINIVEKYAEFIGGIILIIIGIKTMFF